MSQNINKTKFKMKNDLFIDDLSKGKGSLKYYDYFCTGIRLKTKSAVYEAIELKISNIMRKDKITGVIESFNFDTNRFETNEVKQNV